MIPQLISGRLVPHEHLDWTRVLLHLHFHVQRTSKSFETYVTKQGTFFRVRQVAIHPILNTLCYH